MVCCCASNIGDVHERLPLLESTPQVNCRQSRPVQWTSQWGITKRILTYMMRFFFWSSGYNKSVSLISRIYSYYLFLVCWYYVLYEFAKTAGCPEFKCSQKVNMHTTRELERVAYLCGAIGNACSYTFMLLSLNMIYKPASNAISPYFGIKDMGNSKAKVVSSAWLISAAVFLGYVGIFTKIVVTENYYTEPRFTLYIISLVCEFISLWVANVSMYAFACSTFAVGVFASDTFRRIKKLSGGTIDDVIKIHKELRTIVRETTDAYSAWFLLHWLIYGVAVVVGFVIVALHKLGHDEVIRKIYFGTFFAFNLFMFIFPCICAAYVTTACAAVSTKINNTTSEDWPEDHVFKDRRQLQMFVSYCSASPVCFKIGRITFTSTLAWFSFFFGSTGLLFHFF